MLVASFVTNRPTMGDTRTYEDFSKFLGERPHRLGVVSRLYPELTATFLTEALRNIFYGDTKKATGFRILILLILNGKQKLIILRESPSQLCLLKMELMALKLK